MGIRLTIVLFVVLLGGINSSGQQLRDSRGRDFWLAIPPNDHSTVGSDPAVFSLLISTDNPSTVRWYARRRTGVVDSQTVNVPGGTTWEIRFDPTPYELFGQTIVGGNTNDGERASPASIHVVASDDITLYAVTRDVNTSDAWLVLPTDALGTQYRALTYSSDYQPLAGADRIYPSQFVVVATEDQTSVQIDLSVDRSTVATGRTRNVVLDRGMSYLVQARSTTQRQNDDLTGSRIVATKPIVVIASHLRAQVPILGPQASRDCLVEQMPSLDTWGKNIIVPLLNSPFDILRQGVNDVSICRILATVDGTDVLVNGQPPPLPLLAGRTWDLPLTRDLHVTSSEPVLVAIIDRSANRSASTARSGDPSLIVIPPIEQFMSEYRVINVEPRITGQPFYTTHHITCIVPMLAANTLRIDGVQTVAPRAVPGTSFGVVTSNVSAGRHVLTCDSAFGIVVYGYGPAESYGYTGGMAFQRLYRPTIRLRLTDVSGFPGDNSEISVVVDSVSDVQGIRLSGVQHLGASVSLNMSTYVSNGVIVFDASLHRGHHRFDSQFDSLSKGDTIARIPGRHALGNEPSSTTTLVDYVWTTASGDTVDIQTAVIDGNVTTLGVCLDQVPRLFDPAFSPPRPMMYYDIMGRAVGTDPSGLPPGVYIRR